MCLCTMKDKLDPAVSFCFCVNLQMLQKCLVIDSQSEIAGIFLLVFAIKFLYLRYSVWKVAAPPPAFISMGIVVQSGDNTPCDTCHYALAYNAEEILSNLCIFRIC